MIDERDDIGGRSEKTVLDGHIPPPMPKHAQLVQSVIDNLYLKPLMPPPYREIHAP